MNSDEESALIINGSVRAIDEMNFVSPEILSNMYAMVGAPIVPKPFHIRMKYKIKYAIRKWDADFHDFMYKAKHGFKVPADRCCWYPNHCYDMYCEEHDGEHHEWACANCGDVTWSCKEEQ